MGFNRLNRYTVFLTAALVVGLCVAIFFSYHAWSMGERPGEQRPVERKSGSGWCPETGLYLKMQDTLLYIPPELTRRSSVRNNRVVPENLKCYQKGEAPVEVTTLSLFPNKYFLELYVNGKRDEKGRALALWLRAASYVKNIGDDFERLKEKNEIVLERLPKEYGFYVYPKDKITNVFISDTTIMRTPNGHPVVFTCDENRNKYCSVGLSMGRVYFGLDKINRHHVPIEEWPRFYKQFVTLVESLIVKNESEIAIPQKSGE